MRVKDYNLDRGDSREMTGQGRGRFCRGAKINEAGFSLIELLVVTAIFATVSLVILDIFVNVNRSNQRTLAWQQVQSEMRYTMELITQSVKNGRVDFGYVGYGSLLDVPEDELAVVDADGRQIVFRRETTGCLGDVSACIKRQENGGPWLPITGDLFEVSRLDFYVLPQQDPYFGPPYTLNSQPMVTIVLEGNSIGPTAVDQKSMSLQTTVSTRYYER